MNITAGLLRVLVLVHLVLLAWGVLGLLEYARPEVKLGLQNQNFPSGLQFLHFASIVAAGTVFVAGFAWQWAWTPSAMVAIYAVMGVLCFVETVDFDAFGRGTLRFVPMVLEHLTYIGLSTTAEPPRAASRSAGASTARAASRPRASRARP
jgi:hypothetical protein